MAAGILAAPGTEYGPCEGGCLHTDCNTTRDMADSPCRGCGKPIGYGEPFFQAEPKPGQVGLWKDAMDKQWALLHAVCLYEEIDREAAEARADGFVVED